MQSSERNFLLLCDYKDLPREDILKSVGNALELQYIKDEDNLTTLASESFVLDVTDNRIIVTFVDDKINRYLRYVEYYLNFYFFEKEYRTFYSIIKLLKLLDKGSKEFKCIKGKKVLCECINGLSYCSYPSLQALSAEAYKDEFGTISQESFCKIFGRSSMDDFGKDTIDTEKKTIDVFKGYNIFTHQFEFHIYDEILIPLPINQYPSINDIEKGINKNIASIFPATYMNRKILRFFGKEFYFEDIYENFKLRVNSDHKIYINGEYSKIGSFLFKNNFFLKHIIAYMGLL